MLRSVLAVIAGYLSMAVVVMVVDAAAVALFPDAFAGGRAGAWLITALVVGTAGAVLGGYVTGAVARHAEYRHAIALSVLSILMSVASMALYAGQQPLWFQLALLLLGPPAILLGAWLRARSRRRP